LRRRGAATGFVPTFASKSRRRLEQPTRESEMGTIRQPFRGRYLAAVSTLVLMAVVSVADVAAQSPPDTAAVSIATVNPHGATYGWETKADRLATLLAENGAPPDIISLVEVACWTKCGWGLDVVVGDYAYLERLMWQLQLLTGVTYRIAYMTAEGASWWATCFSYSGQAVLYNPSRLINVTPNDTTGIPYVAHDAEVSGLQVRGSYPLDYDTKLMPLRELIDRPSWWPPGAGARPWGPALAFVWDGDDGPNWLAATAARFAPVREPNRTFDVFTIHPPWWAGPDSGVATHIRHFIEDLSGPPHRTEPRYYPPLVVGDFNALARDLSWRPGVSTVFAPMIKKGPKPDDYEVIEVALGELDSFPALHALRPMETRVFPDVGSCDPTANPDAVFSDHCGLLVRFGTLTPPVLTIDAPINGSSYRPNGSGVGPQLVLAGQAIDHEDGPLFVRWESERRANDHSETIYLGTGSPIGVGVDTLPLAYGRHRITASATDSTGLTREASVEIDINDLPTIAILEPVSGSEFGVGELIRVRARSEDFNEAGGTLAEQSVQWSSSFQSSLGLVPVDVDATGHSTTLSLPSGTHLLTVSGTDSLGAVTTASVRIVVRELMGNPPVVEIETPSEDTLVWAPVGQSYADIRIFGHAYDENSECGIRGGCPFVRNDVPIFWELDGKPVQGVGTEWVGDSEVCRRGFCYPVFGTGYTRHYVDVRLYANGLCGSHNAGPATHATTAAGTDADGNTRRSTRWITVACGLPEPVLRRSLWP
jgi:hypothetical protein